MTTACGAPGALDSSAQRRSGEGFWTPAKVAALGGLAVLGLLEVGARSRHAQDRARRAVVAWTARDDELSGRATRLVGGLALAKVLTRAGRSVRQSG